MGYEQAEGRFSHSPLTGFKLQFVRDGTAQKENYMCSESPYNFPCTILLDNLLHLSCSKESLVYKIHVGKRINVSLGRTFTCSLFHPPPCKEDLKWWYSLVKQGKMLGERNCFSAIIVCSQVLFGRRVGLGTKRPSSFLQ